VGSGEHRCHEAPGHARDDGCPLGTDGVHHSPQVVHPFLDRREGGGGNGVRESNAPLVEEDDASERGETVVEPREGSDVAFHLDVAEPLRNDDEIDRPGPERAVSDVSITAPRVTDPRFHGATSLRHDELLDHHGTLARVSASVDPGALILDLTRRRSREVWEVSL
jgi:hypothetical protein